MQNLPKLERVSDEELELLHAFRNLDADRRKAALEFLRTFAKRTQPELPDNVVRLGS